MDPFNLLPPPLMLAILKIIPDLSSLRHFIKASPVAAGTFDELYDEILGAVLATSQHAQVQREIRRVIAVRSDYFISVRGRKSARELEDALNACECPNPPIIKSSARSEAAHSVLEAAYQIQCFTESFFETYLDRVKALRPSHLLDPQFRYSNSNKACLEHPEGRRYEPALLDAPSWIEIQRISRAFWRTQLSCDLVEYRLFLREKGSPKDVQRQLTSENPRQVWAELEPLELAPWELDEINCVYDYLDEIGASNAPTSLNPQETVNLPSIKHSATPWMHQAVPLDTEADHLWSQCTAALGCPSIGYCFFHRYARKIPNSPLQGTSFAPFRRLGFGIWDLKKLSALGVMNIPSELDPPIDPLGYVAGVDKHLSSPNILFTWVSVADYTTGSEHA